MNKHSFVVALAVAVLLAPVAGALDTNVDLKKQGGDTAWDFAIVLEGDESVGPTYDGHSNGKFGTVTIDTAGANTVIHWENPTGSIAGDGIDSGEEIHVGFSTSDGDAKIVDSYWTDENGARIFGSTVVIVGGHIGSNWVGLANPFPHVAHIADVRVGTFDRPWALAELSSQNQALLDQLATVGGGFDLAPGEVIELPIDAADAAAVVVTIEASSPGSEAIAVNFIQDVRVPCP